MAQIELLNGHVYFLKSIFKYLNTFKKVWKLSCYRLARKRLQSHAKYHAFGKIFHFWLDRAFFLPIFEPLGANQLSTCKRYYQFMLLLTYLSWFHILESLRSPFIANHSLIRQAKRATPANTTLGGNVRNLNLRKWTMLLAREVPIGSNC